MPKEQNRILDKKQTLQKIRRIAFEILEQNFKEKELVLAGIYDKGYEFAKILQKELVAISGMNIMLVKVTLDKFAPSQSEVELDVDIESVKNKIIILTDDVQNTGRTMAYSLKPFLAIKVKKLQTAVIVDRNHSLFPVKADYVGYSLSTTMKEHIEVRLDKADIGVYLD